MEFAVREMQHVWLDIYTTLDYMEIYRSWIDCWTLPAKEVADSVSTFTSDVRVAQDFFVVGLPCWLICLANAFTSQNIWKVVNLLHPEDHLILGPHQYSYPIIFTGPSSLPEKYIQFALYCRLLQFFIQFPTICTSYPFFSCVVFKYCWDRHHWAFLPYCPIYQPAPS